MVSRSKLSVYYLDDDPFSIEHIRMLARDIDDRFSFSFFGVPRIAKKKHAECPADIFISDLRMGHEDGLTVISELQKMAPETIYMLSSGAADMASVLSALNDVKIHKFFLKPVEKETIEWGLKEAEKEIIIQSAQKTSSLSESAFDHVQTAILLLDSDLNVFYRNYAAQKILEKSNIICVDTSGSISIKSPAAKKDFFNLLVEIRPTAHKEPYEEKIFRLEDTLNSNALVLSIKRCRDIRTQTDYFTISISDPSEKDLPSASAISQALKINPSEAKIVAGLIECGNLEDAAKTAGVALSTARTYLKTVFSKTGVSRQAELVTLALTSLS